MGAIGSVGAQKQKAPHGAGLRAPSDSTERVSRAWSGGEGGIRTHGELAPTPDFESGTFDHSATSPIRFYATWLFSKSAIVAEQAIYNLILRLKCFDSTHVRP